MSDYYSEYLVKKKNTGKDMAIRVGLIAVTAVSLAGILFSPLLFVVFIGLLVLDYFLFPKLDVEYEYLHVNGELDIDKIFSRQKRKKMISLNLDQMEVMAPLASHRLDSYRQNQNIREADFSSGDETHAIYAMIINQDNQMLRVLLEFDERMFGDIKNRYPRKVFTD